MRRKIYIVFLTIVALFLVNFIDSVVGNPISKSLATSYAKHYLQTQFPDENYKLNAVGYNYKTKMYDYIVTRTSKESDLSYTLSINSKISNRTVDEFKLHPSVMNGELSTRLSNEAKPHVTNIVQNIIPGAKVNYQVYAPITLPKTTVWKPGFTTDLNAVIHITQTADQWDKENEPVILQQIKENFAANGIHYSTVTIRISEEYLKDGITYFKTVFKEVLHESDEL